LYWKTVNSSLHVAADYEGGNSDCPEHFAKGEPTNEPEGLLQARGLPCQRGAPLVRRTLTRRCMYAGAMSPRAAAALGAPRQPPPNVAHGAVRHARAPGCGLRSTMPARSETRSAGGRVPPEGFCCPPGTRWR